MKTYSWTTADDLAEDLQSDEGQISLTEQGDEDDTEDDDVEGWVDEMEEMNVDERDILKQRMHPVKITLGKVSTFNAHSPVNIAINPVNSFAKLPSKSSTRQQFCYQHGSHCCVNWDAPSE